MRPSRPIHHPAASAGTGGVRPARGGDSLPALPLHLSLQQLAFGFDGAPLRPRLRLRVRDQPQLPPDQPAPDPSPSTVLWHKALELSEDVACWRPVRTRLRLNSAGGSMSQRCGTVQAAQEGLLAHAEAATATSPTSTTASTTITTITATISSSCSSFSPSYPVPNTATKPATATSSPGLQPPST